MKTIDLLFPRDQDLIADGVWFEISKTADKKPVRWKINRLDCTEFQGFRETVLKQHEYQIEHDTLDADAKAALLIPGVARYLLTDWENFPPEKPVPCTVEAKEVMLKERSTMYVAVMRMAGKTSAFIKTKDAATVKP